jgi:hypothetical protein
MDDGSRSDLACYHRSCGWVLMVDFMQENHVCGHDVARAARPPGLFVVVNTTIYMCILYYADDVYLSGNSMFVHVH